MSSEEVVRVLIVEDDDDIREVLAEALTDRGYEVHEARHGLDALEHMREHGAPNLILLDLMMPIMNGFDFLQVKARDPLLADIPVVVVTAGREEKVLEGVRATLGKPIRNINLMLSTIEQYAAR